MLTSTRGQLTMSAAANMLTEIVLPKRRGVEIRISCARCSHPLCVRILWWSRANCPGGAGFQNVRVHACRKSSWKMRWWYERLHPSRSSLASAARQSSMRANGVLPDAPADTRCTCDANPLCSTVAAERAVVFSSSAATRARTSPHSRACIVLDTLT
jgi:hypothetical protein